MTDSDRYFVVDSAVMPEVFRKVLEVKELLARGSAKSSSEACKIAGVSRGAYYKYKDRLFHFDEMARNENATFHLVLEDRPGSLSAVLACFYELGANILTMNQSAPNDTVAAVSVSVRLPEQGGDRMVLERLRKVRGVVDAKIL